jgi:hypothetical protein
MYVVGKVWVQYKAGFGISVVLHVVREQSSDQMRFFFEWYKTDF